MKLRLTRQKGYNRYLLFVILLYFFILKDWLEQNISFIGYGDELLALLAVPIFVFELKKSRFKLKVRRWGYGKYVFLFLSLGFLASLIYGYQSFAAIALPDAFLCMKFWLALYVGQHLFSGMQLEVFGKRIFWHVKFITFLYLILFLLDQAVEVFSGSVRYGLRATQLMYSHPTVFVACCVFLIMILLSLRDYAKGYKKWLILLLFLMCTTLRSKAFGTALIIMVICYVVFYRKKKFRLQTLILFVPLVIVLGWEQIEYYFFSSIQSDSARYQLLVKSMQIAKDFFPLGSGFGTFASYYSGVSYSPIYEIYGLTNINGLRQGAAFFISDSFWPMVLGQTGLIGLIAYVFAIIALFKSIQQVRDSSLSYYAAALSGICYLIIASVAESAFVHPLAVPIVIMVGVMIGQRSNNV